MASLVGDPKRNPSARWLLICFYVLLAIGGATMVYPFWLMLKGSISGSLDFKDRALVPRYLYDRDELFLKFLTQRYPDTQTQLLFHIYPVAGVVRPSDYRGHIQAPQVTPPAALLQDWQQFIRAAASPAYLTIADPDRMTLRYQAFLQKKFSEPLTKRMEPGLWQSLTPIERLNRVYHQMEQTFTFVSLPLWKFGQSTNQDSEPIYVDYEEFLRTIPAENLLPISGASVWQTWLHDHGKKPIPFSPTGPADRLDQGSWESFYQSQSPNFRQADGSLICVETDWRNFLSAKYQTDANLQSAWRTSAVTLTAVPLLYQEQDAALFLGQESRLRWQMATANYKSVVQFLVQRGRALQNTVILVTLSILVALVLNPLAAYGLSRYPGPHGRSTLLVMVLTIAFPAEVAMIPSFLLLRDLGLLNTYAALILPSAVSGFSVFLLKGFFDGLPEELFESATIDGANELEVFWNVALPLARPILAVTALGAFTATYGGYMWALLVCQDPEMWTLMVWLFQYQINFASSPWLGMAAFVIASIPTLLVFIFCQRMILRGVIIPTEK